MDSILFTATSSSFASAATATSCAPHQKTHYYTKMCARNNHHVLKCVWPWFHSHIMSWKLCDVLCTFEPTVRGCQTNFMCVIVVCVCVCLSVRIANQNHLHFPTCNLKSIRAIVISSSTHTHIQVQKLRKSILLLVLPEKCELSSGNYLVPLHSFASKFMWCYNKCQFSISSSTKNWCMRYCCLML